MRGSAHRCIGNHKVVAALTPHKPKVPSNWVCSMTVRNLEYLLRPRSVALIGASPRAGSVGFCVAQNLLGAGFVGDVYFVNPAHRVVAGHPCLASIDELPIGLDVAVIATPARTVPALVDALAARQVRSVVCITAGLDTDAKQRILNASRPTCLRMLGPNCVGMLLPSLGLNASFAHRHAPAGDVAFVSQSGALVTTIIDWAAGRQVGFSHILSMGDMTDVDFGDVLDYLAADRESRAILMYMEGLTDAPKFMSAARRAARAKPVVIVKSGRHEAAAKAVLSHTGALAGADAAYDAAFRRAGVLRVQDLEQLFEAAEILSIAPRLKGERLAILTNGGGAGVLAADRLADLGGTTARLGPRTKAALDEILPSGWSGGNPVDIIGDSDDARYGQALDLLLDDPDSDAILVMNCPTALARGSDIAKAIVGGLRARENNKPVVTNWLGDASARSARALFEANNIPTFDTPGAAVRGFMHLAHYKRAQEELMQVPPNLKQSATIDDRQVGTTIQAALQNKRKTLSAPEAKAILAAYDIPVVEATIAPDLRSVSAVASELLEHHDEVALKILSDDISHKSDIGGVKLGLQTETAVVAAAHEMSAQVSTARPDARVDGFTLEPMVTRPHAIELIAGMSVDPTFGPILLFGAGGTAVEVLRDSSMALPPLDLKLARELMARTRVHNLLVGYRHQPAADLNAIAEVLVRLGNLVIAHPEIREIDINPLFADETGVIGLDARMRIEDNQVQPRPPLAIRPYPAQWTRRLTDLPLGTVIVRPIRPHDAHLLRAFVGKLPRQDLRLRQLPWQATDNDPTIARLTQIDYAREMAFLALTPEEDEILGLVHLLADPDYTRADYAMNVRSDLKGQGLAWMLMRHLIDYALKENLATLDGSILASNTTILKMCSELGFAARPDPYDSDVIKVQLDLTARPM